MPILPPLPDCGFRDDHEADTARGRCPDCGGEPPDEPEPQDDGDDPRPADPDAPF